MDADLVRNVQELEHQADVPRHLAAALGRLEADVSRERPLNARQVENHERERDTEPTKALLGPGREEGERGEADGEDYAD